MNATDALNLVKARLGISTSIRDEYLVAIIEGVIGELENVQGLVLDSANSYHLMFVVDLSTWRYQNRDSANGMPRHLQFRLHNLMINKISTSLDVDDIDYVNELPVSPDLQTVYILSDDSKQMFINGTWKPVKYVDGGWVVVE